MPLSGKEIVRLLQAQGWGLRRIEGSHHILFKDRSRISVPVHGNKSLGKGIERKILKQTGLLKQ